MPIMKTYRDILAGMPKAKLLWASTREVLNLLQAEECGTAVIMGPHEILTTVEKQLRVGLAEMSLDTVKMLSRDAAAAGFQL